MLRRFEGDRRLFLGVWDDHGGMAEGRRDDDGVHPARVMKEEWHMAAALRNEMNGFFSGARIKRSRHTLRLALAEVPNSHRRGRRS